MRWIRWRSEPVKRTRPGNGADVVVEELEPNGFADAFVKVAGRVYVDVDELLACQRPERTGRCLQLTLRKTTRP